MSDSDLLESWEDDDEVAQPVAPVIQAHPTTAVTRPKAPAVESSKDEYDPLDAISKLDLSTELNVFEFLDAMEPVVAKANAKSQSQLLLRFLILMLESCRSNMNSEHIDNLHTKIKSFNDKKQSDLKQKANERNNARAEHRGYSAKYDDYEDYEDDHDPRDAEEEVNDEDDLDNYYYER